MTAIAEIVRFASRPGVSDHDLLAAARQAGALIATQPGYLARTLSRGEDGRWTDHLLWADMASAEAAARRVMSDPGAAPFLAAIAPDSIEMRHEAVQTVATA